MLRNADCACLCCNRNHSVAASRTRGSGFGSHESIERIGSFFHLLRQTIWQTKARISSRYDKTCMWSLRDPASRLEYGALRPFIEFAHASRPIPLMIQLLRFNTLSRMCTRAGDPSLPTRSHFFNRFPLRGSN